jgi:hypothetical protein
VAARFPQVPGDKLFHTWASASQVVPQITRFFWGDIDIRWFPEACLSHPRVRGFYTVRHFIEGETMPGSGILNLRQFRRRPTTELAPGEITPLQVASNLQRYAQETLRGVADLRAAAPAPAKELRLTLGDLEAFAHLGSYYAEKILGASQLAFFDLGGQTELQAQAVKHLEAALGHWKSYANVATAQYKPQLLNRVGYVDLNALTAKVEQDLALARNWRPGTIASDGGKRGGADRPFTP